VVAAAFTIPPADREERSMFPDEEIPVNPEAAPAVEISQEDVFTDPASPPSPKVKVLLAVKAPLAVSPEVAVIKPEIVGVAVQAVPLTVKLPPRLVSLLPDTVKVLSKVVAPCKVKAPGVVVEPMVLTDEAPEPKVLVVEVPVPIVEFPDEVNVVNAPVLGVVDPIVPGVAQVPPIKEEALIVPLPV